MLWRCYRSSVQISSCLLLAHNLQISVQYTAWKLAAFLANICILRLHSSSILVNSGSKYLRLQCPRLASVEIVTSVCHKQGLLLPQRVSEYKSHSVLAITTDCFSILLSISTDLPSAYLPSLPFSAFLCFSLPLSAFSAFFCLSLPLSAFLCLSMPLYTPFSAFLCMSLTFSAFSSFLCLSAVICLSLLY